MYLKGSDCQGGYVMLSAAADSLNELQQSVAACSRTIAALQSHADFPAQPGEVERMTACLHGKLSSSTRFSHRKQRYRQADAPVPAPEDPDILRRPEGQSCGQILCEKSSTSAFGSERLPQTEVYGPVSIGEPLVFMFCSGIQELGPQSRGRRFRCIMAHSNGCTECHACEYLDAM